MSIFIPPEILCEIFHFVGPKYLPNCMQCCRHWYYLIEQTHASNSLWYTFLRSNFSPPHLPLRQTNKLLHYWKQEYFRLFKISQLRLSQQLVDMHTDEVWFCAWDSSGKYFCSAGKDGVVNMFELKRAMNSMEYQLVHRQSFKTQQPVGMVEFSRYNGKQLLISESREDAHVIVVDLDLQKSTAIDNIHYSCYAKWIDDRYFVMGGPFPIRMDQNVLIQSVIVADSKDMSCAFRFDIVFENLDMAHNFMFSRDKSFALYMSGVNSETYTTQHKIKIIDTSNIDFSKPGRCRVYNEKLVTLEENGLVTGVYLSDDDRYLFVNCRPFIAKTDSDEEYPDTKDEKLAISKYYEIHMWDLKEKKIVMRFKGHIANSPISGAFCNWLHQHRDFVSSGGEDGNIFVWDTKYGVKVTELKKHTNVVNCVRWNPVIPGILASVSDDKTICLWTST